LDLITLDFETYYDSTYSLSKITTEEYIRSPMFEVIGVAVKVNDGPTEWASGTHEELKEWLRTSFKWQDAFVLAHNTMFDGAILSWKFGITAKAWLDTMSMGRALHGVTQSVSLKSMAERYAVGVKGTEVVNALGKRRRNFSTAELAVYGDYCINDVELTYKIFHKMMDKKFPKQELKVIDIILRMFIEPVLELDTDMLKEHLRDVQARKEQLLINCAADRDDLMSNPKFAELLRKLGVEPPMKTSPATGQETYAFAKNDEGFKALMDHPNPDVQMLVAARLGNKSTLEETRTQRFIDIGSRGALPVPLRNYAAHTGRLGGCLVADTAVTVYDPQRGVVEKRIVNVLADDLVWDGEAFVAHEGVQFSGYQEVITWDSVTGTEDHVVFTDAGEISLRDAMQGRHRITTARSPAEYDVDAAVELARNHQENGDL
jgi:DNA polymerase